MDHEFDPYEELVTNREAIIRLETKVNELITLNISQSKILQETAQAYQGIASQVFTNTRSTIELRNSLALAQSRIAALEACLGNDK